jgi:hypothetical protein
MGRSYAVTASAFVFTVMVPLAAAAYSQADVDACMPDVFRLCSSAIPDTNRVASCLAQNKRQLSPACAIVFSGTRGASASREPTTTVRKSQFLNE